MFRDVRALVFDLDGTLVDSIGDIASHLNAALTERGLPTHTQAQIAEWVGEGVRHLVTRAVLSSAHVDDVLAAFRAHYRAQPVVQTHVYPGLGDVLDAIAPGRKLAVLSNKPHDLTQEVCAKLLQHWPFEIIEGERPGRLPKPDPAGAHAVLSALGCAPRDAVMIGDSEIDVLTAKATGMRSIAVAWGLRPRDVLRHADILVEKPADLAALFT
jgi:phosphoglycolate phosphatase